MGCLCDGKWDARAGCSECLRGYYGPACRGRCSDCGGHGACEAGRTGSGRCICTGPYAAASNCRECVGGVYGPFCNVTDEFRGRFASAAHALARGRYREALRHLARCHTLRPEAARVWHLRLQVHLLTCDLEAAAQACRQQPPPTVRPPGPAVTTGPPDPDDVSRADTTPMPKTWTEVVAGRTRALLDAVRADQTEALLAAGRGDHARAVVLLTAVLGTCRASAAALLLRAASSLELGDAAGGRRDALAALDIDATTSLGMYYLARCVRACACVRAYARPGQRNSYC